VINGSLIESTSYARNKQRNNYAVRTSSGFALVEEFCGDDNNKLQVLVQVTVLTPQFNATFAKAPLISVFVRGDRKLIDVKEICEGPPFASPGGACFISSTCHSHLKCGEADED